MRLACILEQGQFFSGRRHRKPKNESLSEGVSQPCANRKDILAAASKKNLIVVLGREGHFSPH